jgi:hypothetical protein
MFSDWGFHFLEYRISNRIAEYPLSVLIELEKQTVDG